MYALKISRPNEISLRDRRTGSERRTSPRFAVNLDVYWESLGGREHGTISDISTLGCFVLCSGIVEDGETIKLQLPLMSGKTIELWGEVVNHVFEMGFGLRFIDSGDAKRLFLERLIYKLEQRSQANSNRKNR